MKIHANTEVRVILCHVFIVSALQEGRVYSQQDDPQERGGGGVFWFGLVQGHCQL
jgi:hypothetical protein